MSKLYIGNLAHETTEADLQAVFSPFGEIASVKVASDRRGRPKGFAHVDMANDEAAQAAIESLRGTQLNGRTMDIVPEAGRKGGGFRPNKRRR